MDDPINSPTYLYDQVRELHKTASLGRSKLKANEWWQLLYEVTDQLLSLWESSLPWSVRLRILATGKLPYAFKPPETPNDH